MEVKIESQMQPTLCEVCGEIDEYKREDQWLAKQIKCIAVLRNDHILAFIEVFETSLTSSNFFNVCFAILLTLLILCYTWSTKSMCHIY